MKIETITTFLCEKCGTGYRSQRLAAHCESGSLPTPSIAMEKGQRIWIAVDHQMNAAQFGAWDYWPALGFSVNREITDTSNKKHIDYLLSLDPTHTLLIQLLEPDWYEGRPQTHAYLDSTTLNKYDQHSMTGSKIYCSQGEWYD